MGTTFLAGHFTAKAVVEHFFGHFPEALANYGVENEVDAGVDQDEEIVDESQRRVDRYSKRCVSSDD